MLLRGYYFAQNARLRYAERAYFGEIIKNQSGGSDEEMFWLLPLDKQPSLKRLMTGKFQAS